MRLILESKYLLFGRIGPTISVIFCKRLTKFKSKMAAPIMMNLSRLLIECQCLPRDVLVEKIIEDKDVEQLTNLKLQLYEKCKNIKGFPYGEFYQRRKPKGTSHYSSLEERLADDVYELMTCLDTEVISPEIKAMIKQNDSLGADNGNESQSALMPNNEPHNSSVTTNRSSGCMVGGEE
jgi:hypothetical protein